MATTKKKAAPKTKTTTRKAAPKKAATPTKEIKPVAAKTPPPMPPKPQGPPPPQWKIPLKDRVLDDMQKRQSEIDLMQIKLNADTNALASAKKSLQAGLNAIVNNKEEIHDDVHPVFVRQGNELWVWDKDMLPPQAFQQPKK